MKILQIVEAATAGVGRHVLDLTAELVQSGHTVDVAHGTNRTDAAFRERVTAVGARSVFPLSMTSLPSPVDAKTLHTLRGIVQSHGRYDIVHGHASKGGALARLLHGCGARIAYTPNAFKTQSPTLGATQRRMYGAIERRLVPRTDGLICVSPEERAHAEQYGYLPGRHAVIPNGIVDRPIPSRGAARGELGLDDDAIVIGFVGRLVAQKGPELLIESFADTVRHHDNVKLRLAMIGDGELESALRTEASQLGIADRITWCGPRDGQRSMAAFDVLAMPSRYEGFPYVALEAMHAGVPVVATEECNVSGVLRSAEPAGLVVPRDRLAMHGALSHLVAEPGDRISMGAAGRESVRRFTAPVMAAATAEFYDEILGRRARFQSPRTVDARR